MRICYLVPGALSRGPGGREELERRAAFLRERSLTGADVTVVDDPRGPLSIESAAEEELAAAGIARAAAALADEEHDAVVIGCFGDPGLDGAREALRIPVVGPAQASIHLAAQLGDRFALLTVVDGVVPVLRRLVRRYGLEAALAGVWAVDVPVLELRGRRTEVLGMLASRAERAVADGADVLVLGCMTMGFLDVAADLQERIGIPIVNPVLAGLHAAETMVAGALRHSRRAWPAPRKAVPSDRHGGRGPLSGAL